MSCCTNNWRRFVWPSVRCVLSDPRLSGEERRREADRILDVRQRTIILTMVGGGVVLVAASALFLIFLR